MSAFTLFPGVRSFLCVVAMALCLWVPVAQAATIFVDNTTDESGVGCNLRAAILSANEDVDAEGCVAGSGADVIDLSAIADGTIALLGELRISSDIVIQGNNVTIDGTNQNPGQIQIGALIIRPNRIGPARPTVELENLNIVDATTCITVRLTTLTIKSSMISGCSQRGIDSSQSELIVTDTVLTENGSVGTSFGGGLLLNSGSATIENSTISSNVTEVGGGGIYSGYAVLELSNTVVENNSADSGAGISTIGGLVIQGSQLINNNGGGILCDNCDAFISDSVISGNSAAQGAGIKSLNGILTVSNSTLAKNDSSIVGGGLYLLAGQATIIDSILFENTAGIDGGAIWADTDVSITGSTISNNSAADQGGGVMQGGGQLAVFNSSITLNKSTGSGGGVFLAEGTHKIAGSTISENESEGNGGGVFSRTPLEISGSTFSANTAAVRGGGLYAWKNTTQSITNSTLSSNYAVDGGAALVVDEATLSVLNSTITGSTSSDLNGAASIWITDGGSFHAANSILYNPDDKSDCEIDTLSSGTASGAGVNLVGGAVNCDFVGGIKLSADPILGPLADNGGMTLTHLPMAGSPVIDAGSNAAVPMGVTRDQRGPLYPRIADGMVELGAVEITVPLAQTIFSDSMEQ